MMELMTTSYPAGIDGSIWRKSLLGNNRDKSLEYCYGPASFDESSEHVARSIVGKSITSGIRTGLVSLSEVLSGLSASVVESLSAYMGSVKLNMDEETAAVFSHFDSVSESYVNELRAHVDKVCEEINKSRIYVTPQTNRVFESSVKSLGDLAIGCAFICKMANELVMV